MKATPSPLSKSIFRAKMADELSVDDSSCGERSIGPCDVAGTA